MTKNYALILASGGIDSTACIRFYKKMKFKVEALFIDYGQVSRKKESIAVSLIAKHYKIRLKKIIIKNSLDYKNGELQGRNAFLLFNGLLNFKMKNGLIVTGVHSGTGYYDCSEEFIKQMQEVFNGYTQGTIKISVPFLTFNKKEIYDYCILEKIPLHKTYSCELGLKQPCGKCSTCNDLIAIYVGKKQ